MIMEWRRSARRMASSEILEEPSRRVLASVECEAARLGLLKVEARVTCEAAKEDEVWGG